MKKSKTTSSTSQNTSSTMTPTNPAWVTAGTEGLGGSINDFFKNLDPTSLVAGPDPLQTRAAQGAAGLGNYAPYGVGTNGAGFGANGAIPSKADYLAAHPELRGGGLASANIGGARAGQAGSPSSGNPFGDAMSTFNDIRNSGANTYDPSMMDAAGYNATTGNATMGTAHTGQSASLLDNLGAYMSPYTKDVVDASLADYDYGAGQTRAQQSLDLAGSPFAGSRAGIAQSLTEGELNRGRGSLSAGLRDKAFNTGAMLSGQDADRRQGMSLANMGALNTQGLANQGASNAYGLANMDALNSAGATNAGFRQQAGLSNQGALNDAGRFNAGQQDAALNRRAAGAEGLVGTATAQDANSRANIGAQGDIGSMLQALSQAKAGSPLAALAAQIGLWGQLPFDLTKGVSSTGTATGTGKSSTTEMGASGEDMAKMAMAAMAFSDVRLKQDVEPVGQDAAGRRWYDFSYIWDPATRHRGVMAQEVIKTDPDAVSVHASGFYVVNYAKLGVA